VVVEPGVVEAVAVIVVIVDLVAGVVVARRSVVVL
jgi:hypothetical protein